MKTEYDRKVRMMITFLPLVEDVELDNEVDWWARRIVETYDLASDLFVFRKKTQGKEAFITFKVFVNDSMGHLENTQFIQWKPSANVFYTINALNALIFRETGRNDVGHQVDWEAYRDKLFILRKVQGSDSRALSEIGIERYMKLYVDRSGSVPILMDSLDRFDSGRIVCTSDEVEDDQ